MITLLFGLIVIGVVLYLVNVTIPMDGNIIIILNAVVILATLYWVLSAFGLVGPMPHPRTN